MSALSVTQEAPSVTEQAASAHERVEAALHDAEHAVRQGDDRAAVDAYDRVVAGLSAHLVGVEAVVDSAYARRLPGGTLSVRRHVALTRQLQGALRTLQRLLWGRPVPSRVSLGETHHLLAELLRAHCALEGAMLRALDDVLAPDERAALAERLDRATWSAPDRPHPHALRSLRATRLLYRPVAAWDTLFDVIDSRTPRQRPGADRRPGLWEAYLLGRPVVSEARPRTGEHPSDGAAG